MGLLDPMDLILIFWGASKLSVSIIAVYQIYIPHPTVKEGSLFSTSLPTLVTSCLSDDSHSNRYKVGSNRGFDMYSLMISDVEHCHVPVFCIFFGKEVLLLCPLFNWIFFLLWSYRSYIYILVLTPYQTNICKYSPIP